MFASGCLRRSYATVCVIIVPRVQVHKNCIKLNLNEDLRWIRVSTTSQHYIISRVSVNAQMDVFTSVKNVQNVKSFQCYCWLQWATSKILGQVVCVFLLDSDGNTDHRHCIIGIASLALYHQHCIIGIASLVLYHQHCIIGIVTSALHHWHCIIGIVSSALHHWHCIISIV